MKRLVLTSLAALLLALATVLPAAAADPARPFTASWINPDAPDFAAPGCPAGAFYRFHGEGRDQVPLLGLTSISMTHCTFVDFASLSGSFGPGTVTLTAANGDTLTLGEQGTFTMTPNPGPVGPPVATAVSHLTWWVAAGTGRFAGAAGSGTGMSFDDILAGVNRFTLVGTLAY